MKKSVSCSGVNVEEWDFSDSYTTDDSKAYNVDGKLKRRFCGMQTSSLYVLSDSGDKLSPRVRPEYRDSQGQDQRQALSERRDMYIRWTLGLISWLIRFYRLAEPALVVFDEYHFGEFVDNILSGATYFDIHPPLGKLTLALFGWLVGYRPDPNFSYHQTGREYNSVLYYPLREISAVFGVITVPLLYTTARTLGLSWVGAGLCAGLFCFESLNIIQSRLIVLESQLIFYLVLSLYCALKLWKSTPGSWGRLFWLSLTGLASGCSMSVKWTALATPGLIAIVSFFALHFLDDALSVLECAWAGFMGFGVYCGLFLIHFRNLRRTGRGVAFFDNEFRATLLGEPGYDSEARRASFWKLFLRLNKEMFVMNVRIDTRHYWESYWYQWIVNWRGLQYYNKNMGDKWSKIYVIFNPLVCAGCSMLVVGFVVARIVFSRYRKARFFKSERCRSLREAVGKGTFLLCGWVCNIVPFIMVNRPAFVYHYLPGLIYALLLSCLMIDQLPFKMRVVVSLMILSAVVASFVHFAPWIYALAMSEEEHGRRRWYGRWD